MNLQLCTSRQLLRCISNSVELIILPVKPKFLINLILCISLNDIPNAGGTWKLS